MKPHASDIGQYVLVKHLSEGGMANLYLAHHINDPSKLYVIKRIVENFELKETYRKMFQREARISMMLQHPNLVRAVDFGKRESDLYIVLEHIQGCNLKQILSFSLLLRKSLSHEAILYILKEISLGLAYLHNDGHSNESNDPIVHRDLTPHNVMVGYDGSVKIIDFGISKSRNEEEDLTQLGDLRGKVSYMSPEQARGEDLTPTSDIFSLGLFGLELLTGHKILNINSKSLSDKLSMLSSWSENEVNYILGSVPSDLQPLLAQMLNPNPENRPSASQITRVIENMMSLTSKSYGQIDLKFELDEIFALAKRQESHVSDTVEKPPPLSKSELVNLFSILTDEPNLTEKRFSPMNLVLVATLIIGGMWFYFSNPIETTASKSSKLRSIAAVAAPIPLKIESPKVRLKFPHAKIKDAVVEINGRRLNAQEKHAGVDVSIGEEISMRVFLKSAKQWKTKKFRVSKNKIQTLSFDF